MNNSPFIPASVDPVNLEAATPIHFPLKTKVVGVPPEIFVQEDRFG